MSEGYRFIGPLVPNELGRYHIQGTSIYYTSGEPIEYWNQEKGEWIESSIEHYEDYYIVDLGKEVPIKGIVARYK